jgi:hypothetical protein
MVFAPRKFPWQDPKFWDGYRNVVAWEFARFAALADKGQPKPEFTPVPKDQQPAREREDLEASMVWLKKFLSVA